MNKNDLVRVFDGMTPDAAQKSDMLANIRAAKPPRPAKSVRFRPLRRVIAAIPAACAALALIFSLNMFAPPAASAGSYSISAYSARDESVIKLADNSSPPEDFGQSVSNADTRPDLSFYIDGVDIAKVEISCETEFLYIGNTDKPEGADITYHSPLNNMGRLSDKTITLTFDESFDDYGDIEYRWDAWRLYSWASEDSGSRISGTDIVLPDNATEQEKMMLAAGVAPDGSPVGYVLTMDYPEELLSDLITVKIQDRQGNVYDRQIEITIALNELVQTIVTASAVDSAVP